jgi:hypothetical protein
LVKVPVGDRPVDAFISASGHSGVYDTSRWPYFLYIAHRRSDGRILVDCLYESRNDFPDQLGEYLVCPKCNCAQLIIERK